MKILGQSSFFSVSVLAAVLATPALAQDAWKSATAAKKAEHLVAYLEAKIGEWHNKGRISPGCALEDPASTAHAVGDQITRFILRGRTENKCGEWTQLITDNTREPLFDFRVLRYEFSTTDPDHGFNVIFVPPGPREKNGELVLADGFKNKVRILKEKSINVEGKKIYGLEYFGGFVVGPRGIERFLTPPNGNAEVYQVDVETGQPKMAKRVDPKTGETIRWDTGKKLISEKQRIYGKD